MNVDENSVHDKKTYKDLVKKKRKHIRNQKVERYSKLTT